MKKLLVIIIIALFIGLAFIPSFNAVSISKSDDTTPPEIEVDYYSDYNGYEWLIYFIAECSDESGINRVEFTIDDIIDETDFTEPYQSRSYRLSELNGHIFCGIAYDNYENNASECYDLRSRSLDIKSTNDCNCQSNDKIHLAEKLLNRLEKNEVLSKIIDLNTQEDDRPICDFLCERFQYYTELAFAYAEEAGKYQKGSLMYNIYGSLAAMCGFMIVNIISIIQLLRCPFGPYYL